MPRKRFIIGALSPHWRAVLFGFVALVLLVSARAQPAAEPETERAAGADAPASAVLIEVQGPIGPATRDFIVGAIDQAEEQGSALLVVRMDTPGGLDASTRDIVKAILAAPLPVVTWIAPEGARAASAGTYILYASHVAAMSPATNLGAATPVPITGAQPASEPPGGEGDDPDEASESPPPDTAMDRKVINDAVAYIRGLAEKRSRNADWAEQAVRGASSIPASEALELNVIDLLAGNLEDLYAQVDGMEVDLAGTAHVIAAAGLVTERLEPDWRTEFLAVITSPTVAYVLLLIGLYGLLLEGYSPGALVPGVVGGICLLLALYALQMLPVNYAGLGLIVLGLILMIAEAVSPSFGVLGIGGIIALVIGSIILMDTNVPGFQVSRALIGSIATVGGLGLMAIIAMAMKARGRPVVAGREEMIGSRGVALATFEDRGQVFVHSERWSAVADQPVREGQSITVVGIDGLKLRVRPVEPDSSKDPSA